MSPWTTPMSPEVETLIRDPETVSRDPETPGKAHAGPSARPSIVNLMRELEGEPDGTLAGRAREALKRYLAWEAAPGGVPDLATWHALVARGPVVALVSREDLLKVINLARELHTLHPIKAWHEDLGPVLWWRLPVDEAPWAGTPLDSDWPGYHTHWPPLPDAARLRLPNGESPHVE